MHLALLCMCATSLLSASDPLARAVANRPVVNMYSTGSADADVVSQTILGTNVEVLESVDGWWLIRTPDQYTGWVQPHLFSGTDQPYAMSGKVAEVSNLFAHLYRERSVRRHQPLMTAPFEARLEIGEGEDERWLEVLLPDRRTAWVQRGDVTLDPHPVDIESIVSTSKRLLGLPYTWGGASSFGYDCSGFTQMLQRRRGILMPRDARVQAVWEGMVAVEKDALQAGDLVFFGAPDKITHTGMYIGNGEFIHASTHERPVVQISALDDPHWTDQFRCARRPK